MTDTNNTSEVISGSCYRGLIKKAELRQLLLEQELANLLAGGRVIKEDKNRKIIAISTGADSEVFVKLNRDKSLVGRLKNTLRGSKARRSHEKSELLARYNLPGPESFGFVDIFDQQNHGSAHFSELLSNSQTLAQVLATHLNSSLTGSASKLIARLHQQGLIHGDLKLSNVMVSEEELYFVDLDGLRRSRSSRLRARDIARFLVALAEANAELAVTRTAFTTYCQTLGVPEQTLRDRVIASARTFQNKHLAKYQRPARPVL